MKLSLEEKEYRRNERNRIKWEETHKTLEAVTYKQCSICKEWFIESEENFYKASSTTSNYKPYCKKCMKNKSTEWLYSHYDRKKKSGRKQYLRKEIKEYLSTLSKQRRLDGEYKKWQQNNKEKISGYNKKRQYKNHEITKEEWDACKEYFGNCCAYCGLPIDKHLLQLS